MKMKPVQEVIGMKSIGSEVFTDLVKKIIYYTSGEGVYPSTDAFSEGLDESNIGDFAAAISEDIFNNSHGSFNSVDEVRNQVERIISNFVSSFEGDLNE